MQNINQSPFSLANQNQFPQANQFQLLPSNIASNQIVNENRANNQPKFSSQMLQNNNNQFSIPNYQQPQHIQMRQAQQQIQQLNIDVQQEPFFFQLKSQIIEQDQVKFMQQLFSRVSDLKTYQEAKDSASPLTIEKIININFIDIKDQESRTIYEFFDSMGILWWILESKEFVPDFDKAKLKGISHALQPTKINLLKGADLLAFTKKETFLQVIRYLLTQQLEVQACRIIDDLGELIRAFMYFGCARPLREIERIISEYCTSVSQNRQYISPFMTQACQNAIVSPNWVEIFNHYQKESPEYQNRVKNLFLNFEQLYANLMNNPTNQWINKKIDQLYNLENQKEDLDNQTQIDQANIQNIQAEKDIIVKENLKLKEQAGIQQAYINQLNQTKSSLDQEFRQLQVAKNEQEAACQVKIDELAGIVKMQKDIDIANQAVMRELREQIQNKDNKIQQEKKTREEEYKVISDQKDKISMELENAQRRHIEQQNIIFSNKEAIALLEQRVQVQEAQLNHPVQPVIQQIVQQVDIGHSALQLDPLDASIVLIQVKVPCANRITEINLLDIGKPDNNMQQLKVSFIIDVEGVSQNGGDKWTFFFREKIPMQNFGELVNIHGITSTNSEKIGACDLIVKNQNNQVGSYDTVSLKFKLASSIMKQEDQEDN